ncbi:hypothetical protein ETU09_00120 [Apibacter muscae]|uniref:DUF4280 domain-containing protein n=1 Tax=Apibacter muscae TaxID=2509004 RepID=A0A563DKP6_9FLAO|nr:hypothetical protein [Apibacter muscae]TWP30805.1 hypothetical protein ETU09_00120 [Apibacter muscae]
MGSYLPQKTYVVCLNQLGTEYKQLELSEERANNSINTVKLGSESRVFLVKIDKNLTEDFTCKSGCSSGAGTTAIGVGVIAGMGVAVGVGAVASGLAGTAALAAGIAVIPVAGWIIGGALAIGCLAYGLWEMMKSPTCSQMIGYEESQWRMVHPTVRFDSKGVERKNQFYALTQKSKLVCKEPGGILLPFISESLAKQAAQEIGNNNQNELKTNVVGGLFTGFLLGFSFGGATSLGAIKIGLSFGGWTLAGHYAINPYVVQPSADWTADKIAHAEGINKTYEELKELPYKDDNPPIRPTDNEGTLETIYGVYNDSKSINTDKSHREALEKDLKALEQKRGSQARRNHQNQISEKIQNGHYGEDIKKLFTKNNGRMRGVTETNVKKAINSKSNSVGSRKKGVIKASSEGLIGLMFPFISTYFGNEAIRLGANMYQQDTGNSVSVNSIKH